MPGAVRGALTAAACGVVLVVAAGAQSSPAARASIVVGHAWTGRGEWIRGDLHTHTRFSDGASPVDVVAAKAMEYGCDALAITDHADGKLKAATPEYWAAIAAARTARPSLVLLGGLEWNVPPFGGREHATVLMPSGDAAQEILAEFKGRFDDYKRTDGLPVTAEGGLRWLAEAASGTGVRPVVVYNHPSRKDATSLENVDDVVAWRQANDLLVGFESAPGHQGKQPFGSYSTNVPLLNRWDPVAARAGDAWDTLLGRGVDVYGASASSDFHNANPRDLGDYWPCQFAETWFYVPERTEAGVLQAMRAGTYFGAHGHIVREAELRVMTAGLSRPAIVGERVSVPVGRSVTVSLTVNIPERDWRDAPNRLSEIEFIVVTPNGVTVRSHPVEGTGVRVVEEPMTVGAGGMVVRARGRRASADGNDDLMFYTNPIRIVTGR